MPTDRDDLSSNNNHSHNNYNHNNHNHNNHQQQTNTGKCLQDSDLNSGKKGKIDRFTNNKHVNLKTQVQKRTERIKRINTSKTHSQSP